MSDPTDLSASVDATGLGCAPHPELAGSRPTAPQPSDVPEIVMLAFQACTSILEPLSPKDAAQVRVLLFAVGGSRQPPVGDTSEIEALENYGDHLYDCARRRFKDRTGYDQPPECSCGFDAAKVRAALRGGSHQPEGEVLMTTNQCDGCQQGLPLDEGIHLRDGRPWIGCSAERYKIAGESVTDAVGEEFSRLLTERDKLLDMLRRVRVGFLENYAGLDPNLEQRILALLCDVYGDSRDALRGASPQEPGKPQ